LLLLRLSTSAQSLTPNPSRRDFLLQSSVVLIDNLFSSLASFRQYNTVDDVPQQSFANQQSIYAFVERIIDGDTIRVRHVRRLSPTSPLTTRGIADQTLSIRIYGVDCPEVKGKQPYSEEATEFTSQLLLHRFVKITFLRRDQYRRAVSVVETVVPWWKRVLPIVGRPIDISVELAAAGLAELYTGGGAEYAVRSIKEIIALLSLFLSHIKLLMLLSQGKRVLLEQTIAKAQRRKAGMWSLGSKRVSAADHKRGGPAPNNKAPAVKDRALQTSNAYNKKKSTTKIANPAYKTPVGATANNNKRGGRLLDTAVTGLELLG
jgi:endonuclease YncB( thermonuclease family)